MIGWLLVWWGAGVQADVEGLLADLQRGLGVTATERDALRPVLARYEEAGGREGHARNLVAVAVDRRCREACLVTLAAGLDAGVRVGLDDQQAADLAIDALEGRLAALGPGATADQLAAELAPALNLRLQPRLVSLDDQVCW